MAIRRARLPLIILSWAGLAFATASAQTVDTSSTSTSTTDASTTQTMESLQGKNLLWLSATLTKCPTGYTQVTVQTATGKKKACVQNTTTGTTGGTLPQ